jgi:hypothetical protein
LRSRYSGRLGSFADAAVFPRVPRPVIRQHRTGWMAHNANPKHARLYVSAYSNTANTVSIYDLDRQALLKSER